MNALLKLLTPVKPGMAWDEVLTAARVNTIQKLLRQIANWENVGVSAPLLLKRYGDSFAIAARCKNIPRQL